MNDLTPSQIIEYITNTQPHLLAMVIKHAKPYMLGLEDRVAKVNYGTVSVTLHVRAGEVEKMEVDEKHIWLKPKP